MALPDHRRLLALACALVCIRAMESPLTVSNASALWAVWPHVVYVELGLAGQPDFICSGVMVGNASFLTAPACWNSALEAPITGLGDWAGGLRVLAPYRVFAGPNRTLVGITAAHRYVNSPGTDGYRLSLVNMTRSHGADAIGLSAIPTLSSPVSVPAEGLVLSYGPYNVSQSGPATFAWAGVRGLKAVPALFDSSSTASLRVGACDTYRTGGSLFLNRAVDPSSTEAFNYPYLCGNLGDMGAVVMVADAYDNNTWKVGVYSGGDLSILL